MSELEVFRQPVTHCLYTVAFRRMVTGRIEMDTCLAGNVHRLLRGFSRDVGIDPQGNRLFDVTLCATRTPSDTLDGPVASSDMQGFSLEPLLDDPGEIRAFGGCREPADVTYAAGVAGLKSTLHLNAEPFGELGIVAEFGMGIEREVEGKQTDTGIEQKLESLVPQTGDA